MKTPFKWIVLLLLLSLAIRALSGCDKAKGGPQDDGSAPQAGFLSGTVKDRAGNPMQGVRIIVDHGIFFNANLSTLTDAKGAYRIKLPTGSWYAFASHQVSHAGATYSMYLDPDNPAGFGGEGGVRNFTWQLSGTMPQPLSGTYGGSVTFDNFPGVYIETNRIDFVLTPIGLLIDGSTGETIRRRSADAYTLGDIPIGRYRLTATYEGKPVRFRKWNTDGQFVREYELRFEPQIPAQCDNCAKLEYHWEP